MKTFEERMASIQIKSAQERRKLRNRRVTAGAAAGMFALILALTLFLPYSTALPDVSKYSDSPYYQVIQGLNQATYSPPRYKNNFQALSASLSGIFENNGDAAAPEDAGGLSGPAVDTPAEMPNGPDGNYEEVTDNQVDGVIEADLFKRSDKYLFYLHAPYLYVYAIDQEKTVQAGSFCIDPLEDRKEMGSFTAREMYLSGDCSTVIVMLDGFTKEDGSLAAIITLDVSDPSDIRQLGFLTFKGSYTSSRMVGGDILLTYNFGVYKNGIDFDAPETFVPSYGTPGNMQLIDGENIVCPEDVSACRYTVIAKLDGKSLEVKDTAALMSYSQELYVSEDTLYATYSFSKKTEEYADGYWSASMTRITGISYTGDSLEILGSVQLAGSVKDQYSMDQHDGFLRVAASTLVQHRREYRNPDIFSVQLSQAKRNCSLYCIDLTTWQIAAAVENFAPDGDEVTSARFDGDKAYICTAEVIMLTDPVYFFDLSDMDHITWTDTGIIDGYSSSLVNFGGYLLGIGFSEKGGLKLEAYVEGEKGVESIGLYQRECSFPNEYKAYYIDRENNLVGIPVQDWKGDGITEYLLLHFDGYKFNVVKEIPMEDLAFSQTRATVIDGWLYLLYCNKCEAEQVW